MKPATIYPQVSRWCHEFCPAVRSKLSKAVVRISPLLPVLVAAASCGPSAGKNHSSIPPAYRGATPTIASARAIDCLYQDTPFVFVAKSITLLEERIGVEKLLQAMGLKTGQLAEIRSAGIDPDGEVGVAFLDPGFETRVLFASLRDQKRFEKFLSSPTNPLGPMKVSQADHGLIFLPEDGQRAVVIRDGQLFFVVTTRARSGVPSGK